jgi:quercetin dioxygenase-like cupin family protein
VAEIVRSVVMLLVAVALSVGAFGSTSSASQAQDMPPGAVVVMESYFEPTENDGRFQVVQLVVDLPPGTVIPWHIHGGPAYVTVLEGQVIYWEPDYEGHYRPGDMWIEDPGVPGSAANVTDRPVRLLATYLLPVGAPLTTLVDR